MTTEVDQYPGNLLPQNEFHSEAPPDVQGRTVCGNAIECGQNESQIITWGCGQSGGTEREVCGSTVNIIFKIRVAPSLEAKLIKRGSS